jgi:hypothetical protein
METLISIWEAIKGWVLGGGLLTALGTIIVMATNIKRSIQANSDPKKIASQVTNDVVSNIKATTIDVNMKEYTSEMFKDLLLLVNAKFNEVKTTNTQMAELIAILASYFEDSAIISEEKKKELKAKIYEIKGENTVVEPIVLTIEEKGTETKADKPQDKYIER